MPADQTLTRDAVVLAEQLAGLAEHLMELQHRLLDLHQQLAAEGIAEPAPTAEQAALLARSRAEAMEAGATVAQLRARVGGDDAPQR